jgi:hypothetical protein
MQEQVKDPIQVRKIWEACDGLLLWAWQMSEPLRQLTQLTPNVAARKEAEVVIAGPIWHDKPLWYAKYTQKKP